MHRVFNGTAEPWLNCVRSVRTTAICVASGLRYTTKA